MSAPVGAAGFRRKGWRLMLALAAAVAAQGEAAAQDLPNVISPIRIETDQNGVNVVTGGIQIDGPVLSAPAAPNLRFDRLQNAAPYAQGKPAGMGGDGLVVNYAVHTGAGASESFRCDGGTCSSVTGTGSTFGARNYVQAGSGVIYRFHSLDYDTTREVGGSSRHYLTKIEYPNGETISYLYDEQSGPAGGGTRIFHRPISIVSNLGYSIAISYAPGTTPTNGWSSITQAALYRSGATPVLLRRLVYSSGSIIDYGNSATNVGGRTYVCGACIGALGADVETASGSLQLPGETSPTLQVIASTQPGVAAGHPIVGAVIRDGVTWNYSYDASLAFDTTSQSYWYNQLTVTGPEGYRRVYTMTKSERRNVIDRLVEDVNAQATPSTRAFDYDIDGVGRTERVVFQEGNHVRVRYDDYGNIDLRTATPKANSGLTAVTETALYPADCSNQTSARFCYRPTWIRDSAGRQTDFSHDTEGMLLEQTDPADEAGVRRRTIIEYEPGTLRRRGAVNVCGTGAACAPATQIRTEYDYWGSTFLPSVERRIDTARGVTLTTSYEYDNAGRVLTVNGPLPGTGDATYRRYDRFGRLVREVGPLGANNVRLVQLHTYRDSDDQVTRTETATLLNPDDSPTVLSRVDYGYDARRNPVREAVVSGTMNYSLIHRTFDLRNRLQCEARRMNPAVFANVTTNACALGAAGTGADDFGPDRITRNSYDLASQLTLVQRAYLTPLQQNEAAYTYSPNGQRTSVTDANGNRAVMCYDGFDRQSRWMFLAQVADCGRAPVATDDYEGYGYDALGNRTSLRKRDGLTISYHYDALDRMTRKIVPPRTGLAATHTRDVYYGYNVLDLQTFARFDSASGEGITNSYDAFGRLLSSTSNMDGVSRSVTRSRDDVNNRTNLTYGGQTYVYDFDDASRLEGVYQGNSVTATALLTGFTYTPRGQVDLRNGKVSSVNHDYDAIGRLTSMAHAFTGGAGDVTFGLPLYNPASQVERRTRSNDAYAWNGGSEVNRAYTVNGLNQYTTAGTATFSYDANGNLTGDGSNTYVYDVENRLVAVSGARTANLRYDPLGRLYEFGAATPSRRLVWDGDALVTEYTPAGTLVHRYVHGSAAGVDDPLIWYGGGENRRLHADHQGSIIAITNQAGAQTWLNAYDEWGIPNMNAGAPANTGRFQYTGQIWIGELGMYHYKARIYSPTLGRFLQTDPVGYEGGINLYAYGGNDPVNRVDPDGQTDIDFTNQYDTAGQNYAGAYFDMPGAVTILSHGNPRGIGERNAPAGTPNGFSPISMRTLVGQINGQMDRARQSQPVALFACRTGGAYAQQLSAALGGRAVLATRGWVVPSVARDGTVTMRSSSTSDGRGSAASFEVYGGRGWASFGIDVPAGYQVQTISYNATSRDFSVVMRGQELGSRIWRERVDRGRLSE